MTEDFVVGDTVVFKKQAWSDYQVASFIEKIIPNYGSGLYKIIAIERTNLDNQMLKLVHIETNKPFILFNEIESPEQMWSIWWFTKNQITHAKS
jgi:hypothetical protein